MNVKWMIFRATLLIAFICFLFIGCSVPSETSSNSSINASEYPLSPDDPRAQLTIDASAYKDIAGRIKSEFNRIGNKKENNDMVSYETASRKMRIIQPDLFLNQNITHTDSYEGISRSKAPNGTSNISRTIIGTDDRRQVTDTTRYPYCATVKLYMNFPDGGYMGSGVMIGPKAVLTCGHCVYGNGNWATSIQVIPGMNGSYMPFGDAWATACMTTTAWAFDVDWTQDYAVIILDRNIGNIAGWLSIAVSSKEQLLNQWARTFGYPGDKDYGINMYTDYDKIVSVDDYMIGYTIDIMSGQSGSPIVLTQDNAFIRAIVSSHGIDCNWGPYITIDKAINIVQFMQDHE
jgi:V8-like Glu-specific endopeptidase